MIFISADRLNRHKALHLLFFLRVSTPHLDESDGFELVRGLAQSTVDEKHGSPLIGAHSGSLIQSSTGLVRLLSLAGEGFGGRIHLCSFGIHAANLLPLLGFGIRSLF